MEVSRKSSRSIAELYSCIVGYSNVPAYKQQKPSKSSSHGECRVLAPDSQCIGIAAFTWQGHPLPLRGWPHPRRLGIAGRTRASPTPRHCGGPWSILFDRAVHCLSMAGHTRASPMRSGNHFLDPGCPTFLGVYPTNV